MKVAIIGTGNVGKAVFHDLQHVNLIREIILIGRNKDKARGEAAAPFSIPPALYP